MDHAGAKHPAVQAPFIRSTMDSEKINPTQKISVKRKDEVLGEYLPSQMVSLLETGFLQNADLCFDLKSGKWIPIRALLRRKKIPGFARKPGRNLLGSARGSRRRRRARSRLTFRLLLGFFTMALASAAVFWWGKTAEEIEGLKIRLSNAEAANAEWKHKYENVLFAAREVSSNDLVRGKVIIRDTAGKRTVLPDVKVRLYPRAELEAFLSERYAHIAEAGGTDPTRLAAHFLKNIPAPIETTTTNSDGRFECKIPKPGEYVLQTGIRSAKTGALRLWFVAFDSRDPLNTPVDITESNVVRQFNPIFMLSEGR
jgi:hypothetical protein